MEKETVTKNLSWNDIEGLADELALKIKNGNFEPDYLIGITVGGLIPLALLAKKLDINKIVTVSASSYEKDRQGQLSIIYLPEINLKDKKVLLIDEVAETGATLKKVSEIIIEKYEVAELKTATISINKDMCTFLPDFFALQESGWAVFPWERDDFPEHFKN